jgi:hypothetical protein
MFSIMSIIGNRNWEKSYFIHRMSHEMIPKLHEVINWVIWNEKYYVSMRPILSYETADWAEQFYLVGLVKFLLPTNWYYWWQEINKYPVSLTSNALMFTLSFREISQSVWMLLEDTHTHTHTHMKTPKSTFPMKWGKHTKNKLQSLVSINTSLPMMIPFKWNHLTTSSSTHISLHASSFTQLFYLIVKSLVVGFVGRNSCENTKMLYLWPTQ